MNRLSDRKRTLERALDRVKAGVLFVIESLGFDGKREKANIESSKEIRSPSARANARSPLPLPKNVRSRRNTGQLTLKLSAEFWEQVLDALDFDLGTQVPDHVWVESTISKGAIKAAFNAKRPVPGAEIALEKYTLVRK